MEKFTTIKGYAAPMPIPNINTDMITPKYMLKWVTKTGLSWGLFREYRIRDDGSENPDFILNQEPWRKAKLIVALENFGCGSSREHAPWALYDFGIRSIIATSFADIFYNNCFKNGLLPVILKPEEVDQVMDEAKVGRQVAVDLPAQKVTLEGGRQFDFEVTEFRKYCLLNGLDDIGLTLEQAPKIEQFEQAQRACQPWLYDRAPLK
ncbi:3-isopropylmalate dehydratase small subunit [Verminephrobacter eiseniae]|uniref:3-isopropylmalate dehydratase small subunit n=1 Tax=Verminephrobacter eiseniae TaxID=364317 RepID=UPI002238F2E0|nr:3-isopropylmalate dehydratase small subunit [Verminephrobacter eiseniae]MCW5231577.1 3-isopropylmalate dehydratase small subunit [Verminephrobacter eiseniae]MCW5259902.1 3-isopropylmalate dehydratase small subunit [Verminephrobacter eiseniae]MCW5293306.1 3-isopropylmalate dehydratase small subunit [Verminephrobacter eiseniae]MCW8187530.1 3-isopropylmalate dehydratase small subunit [Verminephrobacter eiseniae]MCW8225867.1 3-isopropylmalate dehydratase small subunit [Verminephrobacter eisenia